MSKVFMCTQKMKVNIIGPLMGCTVNDLTLITVTVHV